MFLFPFHTNIPFYTPWKHLKTWGVLMFWEGMGLKWVNKSHNNQKDGWTESHYRVIATAVGFTKSHALRVIRALLPLVSSFYYFDLLLCIGFLKDKSLENRMLYTQQRNYCVSVLRKTKINYYANLNEKKILDNK